MSAALTFGSVGDIIAVCGLAIELRRALSNVRGSPAEYQALQKNLDDFVRILTQVISTYQQFQPSPWLEGLVNVTNSIVDDCGNLIRDVLKSAREKYDESLRPGGSGNMIKDIYKKLEFTVKERSKSAVLRDKLVEAVGRLGLLSSCAALRSQRVDNATLLNRVEELKTLVERHGNIDSLTAAVSDLAVQQLAQVKQHTREIRRIGYQITQQSARSSEILRELGSTSSVITQVKQLLNGVADEIVKLQVGTSNRWYFQGPTEGSRLFEDPFGHVDPFPLNWISSWEGLQKILEVRFENTTGYNMVVQKQYVLEDDCNGSIIDPKRPFKDAFRVRKKVNMNMLFNRRTDGCEASWEVRTLLCPRCGQPARVPGGKRVKCSNDTCGMWFGLIDLAASMARTRDDQRPVSPANTSKPVASDFQRVRFVLEVHVKQEKPSGKLVVYVRTKVWQCHNCGHAGMTLSMNQCCPMCDHHHCEFCSVEEVKLRCGL